MAPLPVIATNLRERCNRTKSFCVVLHKLGLTSWQKKTVLILMQEETAALFTANLRLSR